MKKQIRGRKTYYHPRLKLMYRRTSNSPVLVNISSEPIRNQDLARRRTTAPERYREQSQKAEDG